VAHSSRRGGSVLGGEVAQSKRRGAQFRSRGSSEQEERWFRAGGEAG
jgi:hypothetical protein